MQAQTISRQGDDLHACPKLQRERRKRQQVHIELCIEVMELGNAQRDANGVVGIRCHGTGVECDVDHRAGYKGRKERSCDDWSGVVEW